MSADRSWDPTSPGVIELPSGRTVLGRKLKAPTRTRPDLGVYLTSRHPGDYPWDVRWVKWLDFWVPRSYEDAFTALTEAWQRSDAERVEVACRGGTGRTGTALAMLMVLEGEEPQRAVQIVRAQYNPRAVETPWQHRLIRRFWEWNSADSA